MINDSVPLKGQVSQIMRAHFKTLDKHPASVLMMLVVFVVPLVLMGYTQQSLWFAAALYLNLLALSVYDYLSFRLPNTLNASFFILATFIAVTDGPYDLKHHIIGAAAGLLIPLAISAAYKSIRKRDGLGMGDIKLLAGAGMLLGWPELPLILSIASTLGIIYALFRFGLKSSKMTVNHIPFGPFIAFSTITLWLLK